MTIENFYKSPQWKRLRAVALRRDEYLCRRCKRYGRNREATVVHHILHVDEYPDKALRLDNLISLCAECHNLMHPEKGGSRR